MTAAQYGIRPGFHFRAVDAPPLAAALVALERRLRRAPTAADVVEAARNPKSPFYDVFDRAGLWDDAVAAQQARLHFARKVIESINVVITRGKQSVTVRGFVPTRYVDDAAEDDGYTAIKNVIDNPERARAYLRQLQREARAAAENAAAWAWIVQTSEPARKYVAAAREFADAELI